MEEFFPYGEQKAAPTMEYKDQLAFYKERAEHYAQIVPNLVEQVRTATSLTELRMRFEGINNLLGPFTEAVRRNNATADRLEKVSKSLEEMLKAEPMPAPTAIASAAIAKEKPFEFDEELEDEEDDEDEEPLAYPMTLRVADDFEELISELGLTPKEARRFFRYKESATLELDFTRGVDGGISFVGHIVERKRD